MNATEEALSSLDGIRSLTIDGRSLKADVAAVITDVVVERTIDGTSTLTINAFDRDMVLLKSGIFNEEVTAQVDQFAFGLAQVRKHGDSLDLVFEDLPVHVLRKHTTPIKIEKDTVTHVDFVRRLLAEEPWLKLVAPTEFGEPLTKGAISRGTPATTKTDTNGVERAFDEKPEDSWDAIGRIGKARGWCRFIRGTDEVWYAPETYLLSLDPVGSFTQDSRQGVDNIDFDVDTGKPVATGLLTARMGRWAIPVGEVIELTDMGPASGKWLITSITRSLFNPTVQIKIDQPNPVLPEPDGDGTDVADVIDLGDDGLGDTNIDLTTEPGTAPEASDNVPSFIWPTSGRVTAEFGEKRGLNFWLPPHMHSGIDLGAAQGSPVYAVADGTVTAVSPNNGAAGNMITIRHGTTSPTILRILPREVSTVYMHLSKFSTARGKSVTQGDIIGYSGGKPGTDGAGDATGPHLHFEVRIGNIPVNPRQYLPHDR